MMNLKTLRCNKECIFLNIHLHYSFFGSSSFKNVVLFKV